MLLILIIGFILISLYTGNTARKKRDFKRGYFNKKNRKNSKLED